MLRVLMKSKIHGATVTEANLSYTGSITIDKHLLKTCDICPFERVQIVNLNNGSRVETYVLEAPSGSGTVCMNGGAARWAQAGDKVIIISYTSLTNQEIKKHKPKVVFANDKNGIKKLSSLLKKPQMRGAGKRARRRYGNSVAQANEPTTKQMRLFQQTTT